MVARPDGKPEVHFSWPRSGNLVNGRAANGKPEVHFSWPRSV